MKRKKIETILVTGGFGYVGTFLVNLLIRNNFRVIVVDNLINGKKFKKRNLIHLNKNYSTKYVANIIKKKKIKKIVHLAAFIDSEESVKNPSKYFQNNVLRFKRFLEHFKHIDIDKIIFASSAAVYGNSQRNKISEKYRTSPLSPYGSSKLQGEELLNYFSKKYQFNSYSLRFFNIAGANSRIGCGPFNKSYKHIFNILLKSNEFFINGKNYNTKDGTCVRDYVNVSDVCDVILKLLKKKNLKLKVMF